MSTSSYTQRRGQIEAYFDRTAADAWARLTSDAPVSRIRETVRLGRDRMRAILLSYLPSDLSGRRVLDAGCGTGALAIEAARRGAEVIAIDLSPTLINIARQRLPKDVGAGSIKLLSGDMLDEKLGSFHHVVAMDSLIHYRAEDVGIALSRLAPRIECSMIFTFAPKTLPLTVMHRLGKAFPRGDRSPAIEPLGEARLRTMVSEHSGLSSFEVGRTARVSSGFYTSQALELVVK